MIDKLTFPWARFMRAGMGELGLSPHDFWRSTPREIAAALETNGGFAPPQPLLRQTLNALMELFPDERDPDE